LSDNFYFILFPFKNKALYNIKGRTPDQENNSIPVKREGVTQHYCTFPLGPLTKASVVGLQLETEKKPLSPNFFFLIQNLL
jgi:hypothetical protein